MTILVTGSTGKTSSRLAPLLPATHPPLIASRSPPASSSFPTVRFDWLDSSTYSLPFEHEQTLRSPITAVYIVAPPGVMDPLDSIGAFVKLAKDRGVKRFVFLSSSSVDAESSALGKVHKWISENTDEWAVLRPSWFMENFSEAQHLPSIRDERKIFTATQNGRLSFVSAEDIAAVAARACTDEKPHNTDHLIFGPSLLTYDEVAASFSRILGVHVEHVKLSSEDMAKKFQSWGVPEGYSKLLSALDVEIANGQANFRTNDVERITGKPSKSLNDFIKERKDVWFR